MPKKPQHLSLATSAAGGGSVSGNGSKPKYSLTLHNNKHAQGGGKNPQAATLREGHQQRQHLKALRLMREAGEGGAAEASDYRRQNGGTGLSPAEEAVVGVHLKAGGKSATANGEASSNMTKSGNGSTGMANGAMRAQNNRLWYH
ncbi:hypothetical protein KR032_012209 [Drosophila birchii]|nr:hypothetical protein KR032_012209 [Drosophila birchii]